MKTKTIDQTLQAAYRESDQAAVKITLVVPLGLLRRQHALFSGLQVESITTDDADQKTEADVPETKVIAPASKPAAAKANAAKANKAKKAKAPSTTSKTASAKERSPTKVTIETVSKAINAGHTSPVAIASQLGVSPKVVSTALSRYAKRNLVERVQLGEYRLPSSSGNS